MNLDFDIPLVFELESLKQFSHYKAYSFEFSRLDPVFPCILADKNRYAHIVVKSKGNCIWSIAHLLHSLSLNHISKQLSDGDRIFICDQGNFMGILVVQGRDNVTE